MFHCSRPASDLMCNASQMALLSVYFIFRFLQDWIFHGRCSDPFEEFIILVDPYKLETEGIFDRFMS